jgi:hypothetical protein
MGLLSCALVAALTNILVCGRLWAVYLPGGQPCQAVPTVFPGKTPDTRNVAEHVLRQTRRHGKLTIEVNLSYPSLGYAIIDDEISRWTTSIFGVFEESLTNYPPDDEGDDASSEGQNYALQGTYTVSRPSDAAVSLTFELWTYTGGVHGNLDVITLNYSLLTGQRLELVDLFEELDEALSLMSKWSFQTLARRFASAWSLQALKDGTAPDADNFASLTLTPEGITINFQPYQAAPWAAGAQTVEMPLEELAAAKPLTAVWGR